jgi:hypothetical protein
VRGTRGRCDADMSDDHGDPWQLREMELFFKKKGEGIHKGYEGCLRDEEDKGRVKKTFKLEERFVKVRRGHRRWYQRSRKRCEDLFKARRVM